MAERKSVSGPELRAKNGQTGARTGAGQGGVGARAGVAAQARACRRASGAAASSRARAAGQVTREAVLVGRALCMSRRAPEFATDISNMTVHKLGPGERRWRGLCTPRTGTGEGAARSAGAVAGAAGARGRVGSAGASSRARAARRRRGCTVLSSSARCMKGGSTNKRPAFVKSWALASQCTGGDTY